LPLNKNFFRGGPPVIRTFSVRRYHDEKDEMSTFEERYWERKGQEMVWEGRVPDEKEKEEFRKLKRIAPPDVSTEVGVAPRLDIVELFWDVENATQVQIVHAAVNGQVNELPAAVAGPFDPAYGQFSCDGPLQVYRLLF
jgi:hypothetical protein